MMQHYIYLSDTDSKEYYPGNSPTEFNVQLPHTITLKGKWLCALNDFHCNYNDTPKGLYVCVDIVQESICGSRKAPILRYIPHRENLIALNPLYVDVCKSEFNSLKMYIRDERFQPVSSIEGVRCTLHLKRLSWT